MKDNQKDSVSSGLFTIQRHLPRRDRREMGKRKQRGQHQQLEGEEGECKKMCMKGVFIQCFSMERIQEAAGQWRCFYEDETRETIGFCPAA